MVHVTTGGKPRKQKTKDEQISDLKKMYRMLEDDYNKLQQQVKNNYTLPIIRSSTPITPISCEIDKNTKKFIEMVEFTNKQFERYATDVLRMPKEMLGSK